MDAILVVLWLFYCTAAVVYNGYKVMRGDLPLWLGLIAAPAEWAISFLLLASVLKAL